MPVRNKLEVLKKAYVLSWYIDQDDVHRALLDIGEDEKDVMGLENERKDKSFSWEEMHAEVKEKYQVEIFNFNPSVTLQRVY